MMLPLLVAATSAATAATVAPTIHNNSDCCCVNLQDRSAKNLVSSVEECVASCASNPACHAAVLLSARAVLQASRAANDASTSACNSSDLRPDLDSSLTS